MTQVSQYVSHNDFRYRTTPSILSKNSSAVLRTCCVLIVMSDSATWRFVLTIGQGDVMVWRGLPLFVTLLATIVIEVGTDVMLPPTSTYM